MKRFIFGIMLLAVGLFIAPVSFASDGPTTTKDCFLNIDYSSINTLTGDNLTLYVINHDNPGESVPVDVGKCNYTVDHINTVEVGILPGLYLGERSLNLYPDINEWKTNRKHLCFNLTGDEHIPLPLMC